AARIERREAFAAQFERGGVVLVQPTLEVVISVEADPSYPWIVQKALCRLHGLSRQGLHSDAAGRQLVHKLSAKFGDGAAEKTLDSRRRGKDFLEIEQVEPALDAQTISCERPDSLRRT